MKYAIGARLGAVVRIAACETSKSCSTTASVIDETPNLIESIVQIALARTKLLVDKCLDTCKCGSGKGCAACGHNVVAVVVTGGADGEGVTHAVHDGVLPPIRGSSK
jgi:hypothetical protein